jgi:tetratricopeptide (TPR) repeat protein
MDLRSIWDFGDPVASEARFRALLPSGDPSLDLEIRTQIARALGLQRRFDEARNELAEINASASGKAKVRHDLERGRVENSSGNAEAAIPWFTSALELAQESGTDDLAVDAAHMLGIACPGDEGLGWNLRAIEMANASTSPEAKSWLGSLLNNTAWSLHDAGRFDEALNLFQQALEFREQQGVDGPITIARWSVARCLRSLGRVGEALEIQRAVQPFDPSGYADEEMAECLYALGNHAEARPYFARAFELLSQDEWLRDRESTRLERLRALAANP